MEPETTAPEHGALLVVEIGLEQTSVALVDLVDQSYRLVARATNPSTYGPPVNDPTAAIKAALRHIEATTGRQLLRDDELIRPQDATGNGIDAMVTTTSAAGQLAVAVAGLSQHVSVRSALHAIRSTYTTLLETVALDAGGKQLSQQIATLAESRPDVIVVAGGTEDGALSPTQRLAQIVALLARFSSDPPHVIFAGNSAAAETVRGAVGELTSFEVSANVTPQEHHARIEPTRAALRRLYRERRLQQLPGLSHLERFGSSVLGSAVEDQGLMVRFIARRFNRNVLAITVDSAASACQLASEEHYSEAIVGQLGLRLGAVGVLQARGAAAILRWLPFPLEAGELHNRLLNRLLRPQLTASDLNDLMLDYAVLREALAHAYGVLRDERATAPFDLVIAGGAFADAPRPGLAALALLDAIQPTSNDSELAINLYLDQFGLLAGSGALARINTDAAACLLELDALNNMPLATVIVPRGDVAPGKKMAEVELTPLHGTPLVQTVNAGEIVRLPLARGKRATLRIRPVSGVAIGQNQAGSEVLSDEAAIVGSALGVVIDARPRPLQLPDDLEERRATLLRWLEALDALPPNATFEAATGLDQEPARANGHQIESIGDIPGTNDKHDRGASPVALPASDDLNALRQELVAPPPPKRGLFRRK